MNYYQLIDYSDTPLEYKVTPPTWNGSRVECCFVDSRGLDCLNRLVVGPILSAQDIKESEIALRAFIFHDEVRSVKPGVFCNHISSLTSEPFIYSKSLGKGDAFPGIKEVLDNSSYHVHQWIVGQLYTFSDITTEKEYLNAYYARKKKKLKEQKNNPNHIKPLYWVDMELGEFEHVGCSDDEYYEKIFKTNKTLISNFLKPLPHTGLANYLANPIYRKHQDKISKLNAEKFFDVLDSSWESHKELIDYQLDIPIYPFVAIVLNRAEKREDIPKEIIALREEFKEARTQLWELFDDTKLRNSSVSVTKRILDEIEKETKSIIPKALSKGDNWFPLNFKYLGRMVSLMNSGSEEKGIKETFESLASTVKGPFHTIEAAKIITNQLSDIEWNSLCRRHFSPGEMENLENWRWE